MGFVYIWTNKTNDMMYVGSHKGCVNDVYIGSGVYFKRAYNKNPNDFVRDIVYEGEDFLIFEEKYLIDNDCASKANYYNLKNSAVGGDTYTYASEDVKKRIAHGRGKGDWNKIKDKEKWFESIKKANQCEKLRAGRKERMIGKKLSQKYILEDVWKEVEHLFNAGKTYREINKITGYSIGTLYRSKTKKQ